MNEFLSEFLPTLAPPTLEPECQAPVLRFSLHARNRSASRNVAFDHVGYVLEYGRLANRTGVRFYFLGRRDIPAADRRSPAVARLVGTVVLVGNDGEVITVYRNARAWRLIARKTKYRLTNEQLQRHTITKARYRRLRLEAAEGEAEPARLAMEHSA